MKTNDTQSADLNRREFLKGSSLASIMTLLGGVELTFRPESAHAVDVETLHGPPVKLGVIGLGARGRELLTNLTTIAEADIAAVCDKYPAFLRRGSKLAEKAQAVEDYRKILDNPEIKAVFVATPTHQHREIAVAALQAGKHVYCEVPLAHTIEDARAIALAARNAPKQVFQAGLQMRSDPQRDFVLDFVRSGAAGKFVMARAQWLKKQSWRQTSPNPEREKELNWRLNQATSTGLVGEIGIHQVDLFNWFLKGRPTAVSGYGSIRHWDDGREVGDTAEAVFEYPGRIYATWFGTLANSFESDYEVLYGSDGAVLMRGSRAWLFKEVDAPMLGWEVYAKKDVIGDETGIALVANASKSTNQGDQAAPNQPAKVKTPVQWALANFLANVNELSTAVEDFAASFDVNDKAAFLKYLSEVRRQPAAGYKEAYEATVAVIKANEAICKGERIAFRKEWFEME
jgi:predicted dehydrogenase